MRWDEIEPSVISVLRRIVSRQSNRHAVESRRAGNLGSRRYKETNKTTRKLASETPSHVIIAKTPKSENPPPPLPKKALLLEKTFTSPQILCINIRSYSAGPFEKGWPSRVVIGTKVIIQSNK